MGISISKRMQFNFLPLRFLRMTALVLWCLPFLTFQFLLGLPDTSHL